MSPSIGQQLKLARTLKGLGVAQVAESTHIRPRFIEAMEADQFEQLPSPAQHGGFLRLYADHLGLDTDHLLAILRGEYKEPDPPPAPVVAPEPVAAPEPEAAVVVQAAPPPPRIEPVRVRVAPSTGREFVQAVDPASRSLQSSEVIYRKIGEKLRERRELLSLTLDEIERHTHVRQSYLDALEEGAFDRLASPVQARGMLTSYARFLDLDPEAILLLFADALQLQRLERQPSALRSTRAPMRTGGPSWLRRYITIDLIFGGGLVIVLLIFASWGASRILALQSPAAEERPTAPSISDVLLATAEQPTAEVTVGPAVSSGLEKIQTPLPQDASVFEQTPTDQFFATNAGGAAVELNVSVVDRVWIRVTVDGEMVYEGRPVPGSAFPYKADEQIEVLAGDGAAVRILYNNNDLGPMGAAGQVVDLIYTADEVLSPTPTPFPTGTPTGIPSATPRPTRTPIE